METTVKSLEEKIVSAEANAKGKEGLALRAARKSLKRLQRKLNKKLVEVKRVAAAEPKAKEAAAPAAETSAE